MDINNFTYVDNQRVDYDKKFKYLAIFSVGIVIVTGLACLWA